MFRKALAGMVATAALVLGWTVPAFAHVTVDPSSAPKGAEVTLGFRVPDEQANAATTEVQVFFPSDHPILGVDPQVTPGWQDHISTQGLSPPVQTDDGPVSSYVSEIDWTGGTIPPEHFQEFLVLAQALPENTDHLVFKALQTYSDGTVVRWIDPVEPGQPAPEHPTPVLTLTSPPGNAAASGANPASRAQPADTTAATILSIVAIILAASSLIASGAAAMITRRRAG